MIRLKHRLHVVFTPGTVSLLKYGLLSFLKYSNLQLRVISNGLDDAEFGRVASLCERSERLTVQRFPTRKIVPHGTILQSLFQECDESHFYFMDSDIFALCELDEPLRRASAGCDIFSSCSNARRDPAKKGVGLGGLATVSPSGLPVAASFFAIYDTRRTRALMETHGVTFERYLGPEQLPPSVRDRFQEADRAEGQVYDTGKALSLLASYSGYRVKHEQLEELLHLGRMSIGAPDKGPKAARSKQRHTRPGGAMRDYFGEILLSADRGEEFPEIALDPDAWAGVEDAEAEMERTRAAGRRVHEVVRQLKLEYGV
ncbi:MAG: hypothetical protein V2A76_16945 [Planctomycetota bacterium]